MNEFLKSSFKFVEIPKLNIKMSSTEVIQRLYTIIMGSNPSQHKASYNPVESVSWYDAIYFCNLLSDRYKLIPAYALNGSLDVKEWDYIPHTNQQIAGILELNGKSNGYRLPTLAEYEYAVKDWECCSDSLDEIAWYRENSGGVPHRVAQKMPNLLGLYDMVGNVSEWLGDFVEPKYRYCIGGYYDSIPSLCSPQKYHIEKAKDRAFDIGFRLVRNI